MSGTVKRSVLSVAVKDIEKRYQPTRCYKFVLEVTWTDKSRYVIYRSFSEFYELHMYLVDAFPIEAGEIHSDERVLPKLSGGSLFSRNEVHKVAEKRRGEISDYCNRLMTLPPKVAQFPKLLDFFVLRDDDLNVPSDTKTKKSSALKSIGKKLRKKKKSSGEEESEFQITGPLQLQTYRVIAPYKSLGKGQINLQIDDQVDVIDKNSNGWWYVACNSIEGWAPATYLERVSQTDSSDNVEKDEIPCMAGELFLSLKEYKAEFEDELTFGKSVVLEVLNKVLDGWWIASYNDKVGYVPSTYLMSYNNPYLTNNKSSSLPARNSPVMPTPRRQSIKTGSSTLPPPAKRDLQPYRRATEKRRQRSVKVQKPSLDLAVSDTPLLSQIMESDDESDYLRPDSTDEGSVLSSQYGDYVDPDTFIPPDHIQSAVVNKEPPNKLGLTVKVTDVSMPAYQAPGSPAGSRTPTSAGLHKSLPRNVSDNQLVMSRQPPPRATTRSESDNSLVTRAPDVPPHATGPEDDYELVHDYDKPPVEELDDLPPTYNAPAAPDIPNKVAPAPPISQRINKLEGNGTTPHAPARPRQTPPVKTPEREENWPAPPPPMQPPPAVSGDYEAMYDASIKHPNLKPITATHSMLKPPPKSNARNQPTGENNGPKSANNKKMINMRVPPPSKPSNAQFTRLSKTDADDYEYNPVAEVEQIRKLSPPSQTKPVALNKPPPKPSEAKLTRLSRTDSDSYEYNPIAEVEQITTAPKSPPTKQPRNVDVSTGRKKPPSPPIKQSSLPEQNITNHLARLKPVNKSNENLTEAAQAKLKPAPRFGKGNASEPASQILLKPVPGNKTIAEGSLKPESTVPKSPRSPGLIPKAFQGNGNKANVKVTVNNNTAESEDGLVYEELLIKPSQMKGHSNAQVRQPKKSK